MGEAGVRRDTFIGLDFLFCFHHLLFLLTIVVFLVRVAVGLLVKADGRLDREVSEQGLSVAVQVIIGFRFGPEKPVDTNREKQSKTLKHSPDSQSTRPTCTYVITIKKKT